MFSDDTVANERAGGIKLREMAKLSAAFEAITGRNSAGIGGKRAA